jgi:hypothetical protein
MFLSRHKTGWTSGLGGTGAWGPIGLGVPAEG